MNACVSSVPGTINTYRLCVPAVVNLFVFYCMCMYILLHIQERFKHCTTQFLIYGNYE